MGLKGDVFVKKMIIIYYSREEGSSVYQAAKTGIVPSLRTILAKFSAQDQ